jgi:hypothetical protein
MTITRVGVLARRRADVLPFTRLAAEVHYGRAHSAGAPIVVYSAPTTTYRGVAVQDIMIRIETDDFEAWKTQHYLHAQNRLSYGITDGPAYQDMDNPNAALFHIKTDDMDRAMEWFKSDTFKEASRLAKVTGRTFYLAQPQAR